MRRMSATLRITVCLLLFTAARTQAVHAATYKVPSGTYMQSCKDCTLGPGSSFSCTCNNKQKSPLSTSVDLSKCVTGSGGYYSLTNNNGSLVCDQHGTSSPSFPSAIKVPTGSYSVTCTNCSIDPGSSNYTCQCEGDGASTVYYINCPKDASGFNQLTNQDGYLICTR